VLARTYLAKGAYADSLAAMHKALELDPDRPDFLIDIAGAYQRSGQFAAANRSLEEWRRRTANRYDTFYTAAVVALLAGHRDEAFAVLERAYREHSGSLILINVDPAFDALRGDPRVQSLVHRLGLDHSRG
jgi:tetratricopeptide (TPR) repeat protein